MKKWAIALFAIAAVFYLVTADTPSAESGQCEPGTSWKEDCNACFCNDNGVKYCTKIGCIKGAVKRSTSFGECEPGDTWKDDCNSCFCTSTGLKACTLMACIHNDVTPQSESD